MWLWGFQVWRDRRDLVSVFSLWCVKEERERGREPPSSLGFSLWFFMDTPFAWLA